MFNHMKQKSWDEGSEWGLDTFAFIVEVNLYRGMDLQEAYDIAKDIMVNKKNLQDRLTAYKESDV
jgi:hypothetical protein